MPPTGRLAPSPTGHLHLGHARSFLLAWCQLRAAEGVVRLRLEDLDGPRVRPELIDDTLRDLEWLGLDWDGAWELQSRGVERIVEAGRSLVSRGLAYACTCSRADVRAAQSAPQQGDVEPRYPGTCRDRWASVEAAESATGRSAGVRFAAPDGEVRFTDEVVGPCAFDVAGSVGDFLIAKRDGAPAYQLAVVVDDAAAGVDTVLRGDDLLASTARQRLLQQALGLPSPRWFHVPLVTDGAGRRLAKRHDDLALATLRRAGVDARAVVAWVACSAGLTVGERLSARELVRDFTLSRLPRTPVPVSSTLIERLLAAR